jgi:hypothetical protein
MVAIRESEPKFGPSQDDRGNSKGIATPGDGVHARGMRGMPMFDNEMTTWYALWCIYHNGDEVTGQC